MSIQTITNNINTLEKELADLAKKIADEIKVESDNSNKIIQIQKSINKNTSISTLNSKQRDITRCNDYIATAKKKRADFEKKRSEKTAKLARYRKELLAEEAKQRTSEKKMLNDTVSKYDRLIKQVQQEHSESRNIILSSNKYMNHNETSTSSFDVFISHASEDKDDIAKPLYEKLSEKGVIAFYDENSIAWGDSLRKKIDNGLSKSRFAIVILSPNFFIKKWTNDELDGLFSLEVGNRLILPLWHNVSKDEVAKHSPLLAGRKALKTADFTIDEIADMLIELLHEGGTQDEQ